MPNWCENELYVSGPTEELKKFREFANPLSAEKFLPVPEELMDISPSGPCGGIVSRTENGHITVNLAGVDIWEHARCRTLEGQDIPVSEVEQKALFEKYGARDWREWRVKHWGTKWDFCECNVVELSNTAVYRFDTAWDPPIPVIEKMAEMYPNLSFLFTFGGVEIEYSGSIYYVKGDKILSKLLNYSVEKTSVIDNIISEILLAISRNNSPEMGPNIKYAAN